MSSSWYPMDCSLPGCSVHGISQARILTEVGCHFLPQWIFATQRSNPRLLHCRCILYRLSHQGSPTPRGKHSLLQNEAISVFVYLGPFYPSEISFCYLKNFERDEETCFTVQNIVFFNSTFYIYLDCNHQKGEILVHMHVLVQIAIFELFLE